MTETVLVTGISGFVAKHVALEFLKAGYRVRGTVRSKAKGAKVVETLAKHTDIQALECVEADLNGDAGWDEAMQGCDHVAHVASPFPMAQPKDEGELVRPAVEGTLRVLRAAKRAGVKRFVQTSSVASVMYDPEKTSQTFDEDDWTNVSEPGITAYVKSKTLAERAAREFIEKEGGDMHFGTINPGLVLGPPLDSDIGTSLEVVQMLLSGKYPGAPRLKMPAVDVRDIAKMHRLAVEIDAPSGGRYLGVSSAVWMMDIAQALRKGLGDKARKAPKFELPNLMVKLVGLFDPGARSIVGELGLDRNVDNSRTRQVLGMDFIPVDDAILASGESLIEFKLV